MSLDHRAAERLHAMVVKADELLKTYQSPPSNFIGFEGWVSTDLYAEWRTQSLNLMRQLLGQSHTYATSFEEATEKPSVPSSVKRGKGILEAARQDLANDHLFETRALIEAEVFGDFLEIARYLLDQGYKDPAASLVGAVLEDGLRKIAAGATVPFLKSDGLDALNGKLAKAGRYNNLTQSKVDTWRRIRNSADHGNFTEYATEDVRQMLEGVTDLLSRFLT